MSDKDLMLSGSINDPSSVLKNSLRFGKPYSSDEIDIQQVGTLQDFFTGMSKLHAAYLKLGLVTAQPGNMLFSPWFFTAANRLFLAKVDEDVIGTIALIKQSGQGLPAEKVFAREIDQSGCCPERTAEIGSLCIDESYRGAAFCVSCTRGLFCMPYFSSVSIPCLFRLKRARRVFIVMCCSLSRWGRAACIRHTRINRRHCCGQM